VAAKPQERPRHGACDGRCYGAGHPMPTPASHPGPPRLTCYAPKNHGGAPHVRHNKGSGIVPRIDCFGHPWPNAKWRPAAPASRGSVRGERRGERVSPGIGPSQPLAAASRAALAARWATPRPRPRLPSAAPPGPAPGPAVAAPRKSGHAYASRAAIGTARPPLEHSRHHNLMCSIRRLHPRKIPAIWAKSTNRPLFGVVAAY